MEKKQEYSDLENKILLDTFWMKWKLYSFIKPWERIFYWEATNYEELKKYLQEIKIEDWYEKPTFNIYPWCNWWIIIRFIRKKINSEIVKLEYIWLKFFKDFQKEVPKESKGKDFKISFSEKNNNLNKNIFTLNKEKDIKNYKDNIKKFVEPYIVPWFNINDLKNENLIKKLEKLYKFVEKETWFKYKSFIPNKKWYTTFIPFEEVIKNPESFKNILDLKEYNKKIFQILSQK